MVTSSKEKSEIASEDENVERFSVSYVTQGKHRFYTLTMPSEILASCSFATSREEDPIKGFQRVLDKKRAEEIATYIDSGLGTIPNSIILSAQPSAELTIVGKGKTLQFKRNPHAFLLIDGQHRVYGFHLAKTSLRVPVVIYNGLTKAQETQLFIDINTKQRPVPSELLLDIKRLAEIEDTDGQYLAELFDRFYEDSSSALLGLLSPSKKSSTKISRVTFNAAFKPILSVLSSADKDEVYRITNSFLLAVQAHLRQSEAEEALINPIVFRAVFDIFKQVAQRVKDRFGRDYSPDNFFEVLVSVIPSVPRARYLKPGNSYKDLSGKLAKSLTDDFTL
ncbi:DGQHR domain-containing protein [Massilia timonae]|uniref:DGQHR domain-containing protein n=1 Tax=Massilia timonae TaxID=47229 RepID=UPI0028D33A63|nr:DGQHR domain-containing protein [Massilia timonae]